MGVVCFSLCSSNLSFLSSLKSFFSIRKHLLLGKDVKVPNALCVARKYQCRIVYTVQFSQTLFVYMEPLVKFMSENIYENEVMYLIH